MADSAITDFAMPSDTSGMKLVEMFDSMLEVINRRRQQGYRPREVYFICRVSREQYEEYMAQEGHNLATALAHGIIGPL